jgi:hypothetical protein
MNNKVWYGISLFFWLSANVFGSPTEKLPALIWDNAATRIEARAVNLEGIINSFGFSAENEEGFDELREIILRLITYAESPKASKEYKPGGNVMEVYMRNTESLYFRLMPTRQRILIEEVSVLWPRSDYDSPPSLLINNEFLFKLKNGAEERLLKQWVEGMAIRQGVDLNPIIFPAQPLPAK